MVNIAGVLSSLCAGKEYIVSDLDDFTTSLYFWGRAEVRHNRDQRFGRRASGPEQRLSRCWDGAKGEGSSGPSLLEENETVSLET